MKYGIKAPVGSIQKFSVDDGPGIRTTVFLKGCPLRCRWCHNPELIEPGRQLIMSHNRCIGCGHCISVCPEKAVTADAEGRIDIDRKKCTVCLLCAEECFAGALKSVAEEMTAEEVVKKAAEDKGFYENTGGGITISGGEMLSHGDFVMELIELAAEEGISVCLDTSGYGDGQLLRRMASSENVTHILYDIKGAEEKVHMEYTGADFHTVLKNLEMLASDEKLREKIIIRMPIIGGVNDYDEIIKKAADIFSENGIRKVCLLPYHNLGTGKMRNIGGVQEEFVTPSEERMNRIESIMSDAGCEVEISGLSGGRK